MGSPWRGPRNARRELDRLLELADVPKRDEQGRTVDLHALRHTFATRLARSGVELVHAQKLLGHSDPKLTAGVYTHLAPDDLRAAVESAALRLTGSKTATASEAPPGTPTGEQAQVLARPSVAIGSGGRIRTCDLRVMSPTSCQTAPPRDPWISCELRGGDEECRDRRGRVKGQDGPRCERDEVRRGGARQSAHRASCAGAEWRAGMPKKVPRGRARAAAGRRARRDNEAITRRLPRLP